jgi:hypothetical protein
MGQSIEHGLTGFALGVPAEDAGLYKERKALLRQLAVKLKQRPAWTAAALKEQLPGLADADMDLLLPRIAYMFRNGDLNSTS